MKKYLVLFLVGLLFASFSTASALDLKGKFAISGNGGLAIPLGDFADKEKGAAKTGFDFYGTFEYFPTDNVSVGGFFAYYAFGMDTDNMEAAFEYLLEVPVDIDVTQKATGFGAFAKYLFPAGEKISPYVKFGVGMGKPTFSGEIKIAGLGADIDGDYDSKFSLFGGGGILYKVSPNVGLNFEALFIHLASDGAKGEVTILDQTESDEIDFNMQGLTISAGLFFFFGGK